MKFQIKSLFLIAFACVPGFVLAQNAVYEPIVGIPGVQDANDFDSYIDALYALSISIAALIAVIKIVIAGAKYMLSDLISTKSDAKNDIQNSLIGLLIIIAAVLILNTINSDLTALQIFDPSDVAIINTDLNVSQTRMEDLCAEKAARGEQCDVVNCGGTEGNDYWDRIEPYINNTCNETDCKTRCEIGVSGTYDSESDSCTFDTSVIEAEIKEVIQQSAITYALNDQSNLTNDNNVIGVGCSWDDQNVPRSCQPACFVDIFDSLSFCPSASTTENRCQNECESRDGFVGFDVKSRTCILDTNELSLNSFITEFECTYYTPEDQNWSWDGNRCMNTEVFVNNPNEASFSTEALSSINTRRVDGLKAQGYEESDVSQAVFINIESMDTAGLNQADMETILDSDCDGQIVYDSSQVITSGGYAYIGFYCIDN